MEITFCGSPVSSTSSRITPEAGQVECRVDPADPPHPLDPALAVRRGVGAQAAQVVLVRGPGRTDHLDAAVAGDLQHRGAHSPGRAAGEQRLSRPDTGLADEAQRGLHDGRVSRGLFERQLLGHAGPRRQHGELGVGVDSFAEHAVSDLDPFDSLADLVHHPRGVKADPRGQFGRMGPQHLPLADPPVDGVHTGSAHGDTYPPGTRMRILGIDEVQHVRAAELGKAHFFHAADRSTNR